MEKKRVLLGMSGGTDSSVAAMLLQEAGYEVTGVTFRFYDSEGFEESLDDARNLASRLNIPHIIYDARELFRERIIRYFVDEYLSARTPVPCTLCNNELKWPLLAKIADEMGIYWISTGHYVRKVFRDGYYFIAPAAYRDKDQTFFLWGLQQNILERMLLPMGDWTKNEVRAYAAKRGFERTATKKDSLGVCFCPMDYRSFLQREVPQDALPGKGCHSSFAARAAARPGAAWQDARHRPAGRSAEHGLHLLQRVYPVDAQLVRHGGRGRFVRGPQL
mgnify:CR=1 FL=1